VIEDLACFRQTATPVVRVHGFTRNVTPSNCMLETQCDWIMSRFLSVKYRHNCGCYRNVHIKLYDKKNIVYVVTFCGLKISYDSL